MRPMAEHMQALICCCDDLASQRPVPCIDRPHRLDTWTSEVTDNRSVSERTCPSRTDQADQDGSTAAEPHRAVRSSVRQPLCSHGRDAEGSNHAPRAGLNKKTTRMSRMRVPLPGWPVAPPKGNGLDHSDDGTSVELRKFTVRLENLACSTDHLGVILLLNEGHTNGSPPLASHA